MMRAASYLWDAAGRPDPRRKTAIARGECYWCAVKIDGPACRVDDVITTTFTDQDQAAASTSPLLCPGCAWTMTGRPPDTLRLWSIAWRDDGVPWPASHELCKLSLGAAVHAHNKADPSAFRALLRHPPAGRWCCSIADSGQIHTAPFAPLNLGADRYGVRFERVTVWTSAAAYRQLDDAIATLMAAGFTKGDIDGAPSPVRLSTLGAPAIALWQSLAPMLARHRGGDLLALALFLARKETVTHEPTIDTGAATDATTERRGTDAPRGEPLARDDAQHRQDQPDRLVGPRDEGAAQRGAGQLDLFGVRLSDGQGATDRRRPRR